MELFENLANVIVPICYGFRILLEFIKCDELEDNC